MGLNSSVFSCAFMLVFQQHIIQQHRTLLHMPPQSPAYLQYVGLTRCLVCQITFVAPTQIIAKFSLIGQCDKKNHYPAADVFFVTLHGWFLGVMPCQRANSTSKVFLRHFLFNISAANLYAQRPFPDLQLRIHTFITINLGKT